MPDTVAGDAVRFRFTADELLPSAGEHQALEGDHRSDLFSLGVLLFWMASGHYPHNVDFNSIWHRSEPASLLDWALDLGQNEPWVHLLSQLV